jgi:hypothetical protein
MRKYNGAWRWMDRVEWSAPVPPNASWARIPDGTGPWTLCTPFSSPPPTPGSPNDPASVDIGGAVTPQATAPLPYPNPAASGTSIRLPAAGPYRLTLPLGQTTLLPAATGIWETAGWPAGVYVIQPLSQLGVHWRVILTAP